MKLKIKKEVLLDAMNKVSKAISVKNLVPILQGIKFELTSKGLTLTASDNDISIQVFVENSEDMKIEKEGSIVVQGKYILDIIRNLPSDNDINIEVIDNLKIYISTKKENGKKIEYYLNGNDKNEYPSINLDLSKNPIEINNKVFKKIINQTSFATSTDESRPILTGINFKINGDNIDCNATDSFRLARKIINLKDIVENNYDIVISSKNLLEFMKIIDDSDDNLELHIFNNKILIKYKNILFQSRLINSGNYPPTASLIPDDFILNIKVDKNELYSVINRVKLLSTDPEKTVVILEIDDDKLIIKSNTTEIGNAEEEMNIIKNNKENIKIAFIAKYMMDALKSFDDDTVDINFVGEVKPIVLKSEKDEGLTQLVLPVRSF